ncbi:hypothetical protein ACOJBM_02235 [Rhizobium beringeri]
MKAKLYDLVRSAIPLRPINANVVAMAGIVIAVVIGNVDMAYAAGDYFPADQFGSSRRSSTS